MTDRGLRAERPPTDGTGVPDGGLELVAAAQVQRWEALSHELARSLVGRAVALFGAVGGLILGVSDRVAELWS